MVKIEKVVRKAIGFTLIELLVVITIIAILAGMFMPAFAKTKEETEQEKCVANLKKIGQAIIMYAQDYEGWLPAYSKGKPTIVWAEALSKYVCGEHLFANAANASKGVWDTYYCPSNKAESPTGTLPEQNRNEIVGGRQYYEGYFSNYVPNDNVLGNESSFKNTKFQYPSKTVVMGEGNNTNVRLRSTTNLDPRQPASVRGVGNMVNFSSHTSGANFLMLDNHVEFYTPDKAASDIDSGNILMN